MEDVKRREEQTDEICDKCGSPLILKWGKFGSFYACSSFSKAKPVSVAASSWKKDPKAIVKKITNSFTYPMTVKPFVADIHEHAIRVESAKELTTAVTDAARRSKKIIVEPVSCDFTKENFAAKPDLTAPGHDAEAEEEFCDNCGRVMVLKNGPWGPFMSCPGYSRRPALQDHPQAHPEGPAEAPRRARRGLPEVRQAPAPPQRLLRRVHLLLRLPQVQVRQAGAPRSPLPQVRRRHCRPQNQARRHPSTAAPNTPKCDFASNIKLVNEPCPKGNSPYLLELVNSEGTFLVCPHNHEGLPKKRPKKGAPEEPAPEITCDFKKKIAGPPTHPHPHGRSPPARR